MMAFIVRLALRMNAVSRMTEKARSALEEEVAARRRTEEALRGSEERVRLLLNSTAESIYGIDLEGRCTFANPACARVLGYPDADSFLGKNMHALIHHSYPDGGAMVEESCRIFRAFREGAGVHCDDEVLWRSDGTSFPAEYWSYPQFREGRTVGAVVTFLDITERKRAEKALADASRNLESQVEERTRSLRDAHERIMEQRLLEHDLQVAGQAQINLLPKGLPVIEGFDLVTVARPARLVSGDFFDYQVFGARFCSILLADIAGKGLPSALLAASARSLYRRALLAGADRSKGVPPGPEELLDELNREMLPDLERSERFLTMIAARLDLGTGALEIANAGGCKVIVFDAATHESRTLEEGGLPMGIFAALGGTKETVGLRPGMGAVFYSDGITEAVDPKGELFGLERLLAEVNRGAHLGPDELAQRTLAAVEAFQAGLPLSDDLSLIVLKAKPRRWRASFATSLASLDEVPLRVAEACFSYGAAVARDLELVVSEMLSNIREHGYAESEGPVELELRCETRGVELVIREWGRTFDMSALSPPPLGTAEEGGFGLFLIREVMEHFSYEPGGADGNLWIGFRSI
jgi:PAS domain S-box-containing protein